MRTIATMALLTLLTACAPMQDKEREQADLNGVAMQVKTQLINQDPMAAAAVQVEQRGDQLYLTGFADSAAKKKKLEQIARQAAGGRTVVNQLEIK